MKINLLLSAILVGLAATSGFAQSQLPNSGFENWITAGNGHDSLIDWSSSNAVVFNEVISSEQSGDAFSGDYAVAIHTTPFGFSGASTNGVLVNGEATFNYFNQVYYESGGGTPIDFKPNELSGFYKYETFTAGDEGLVLVILSKYNDATNQRDTVSAAEMAFIPSGVYTEFSIPLPDLMPGIEPDSITTIFYSSSPATVEPFYVSSTLILDSLTLWYPPTDVNEIKGFEHFKIFPNPSTGYLNIESVEQIRILSVFNSRGIMVGTIPSENSGLNFFIDLSAYPVGVYYLSSGDGRLQKVILEK